MISRGNGDEKDSTHPWGNRAQWDKHPWEMGRKERDMHSQDSILQMQLCTQSSYDYITARCFWFREGKVEFKDETVGMRKMDCDELVSVVGAERWQLTSHSDIGIP